MKQLLLLVEDEPIMALYQARRLRYAGFDVVTASTGEEAVNIAISLPEIDCVLMDICLGSGIDGIKAASGILSMRSLPVIFLTSREKDEYTERLEALNYTAFLKKDGDDQELFSVIYKATGCRHDLAGNF